MKKIYLLTTGLCISIALMAQSPGGVSTSLALWLRADASGTLSSTDSLNSWTYFNNANVFTSVATNRPIVQNSTFNFLPSVFFNGAQEMLGPTGASAPIVAGSSAYAIFAVWSSNVSVASGQRVWTQKSAGTNDGAGAALWLYNGNYGDQTELNPFFQTQLLPYTVNQPYVSELNLLHANTMDFEQVDQTNVAGSSAIASSDPNNSMALTDRIISNVVNQLGARSVPTDEPFVGNLAELIIYDSSVNNTTPGVNARNQIFSYLGMKYGIPLGISLLSSAGATIWDATAHSTYNHDVFGLAVDNGSGLNVQQSNASTTGSANGAGVSGAGNIVLSPFAVLSTDQSFLMIGHDNGSLTESTFDLPPGAGGGSERLQRNWWVQNTNSVGPVDLSFDFTGLTTTGAIGTPSDFRLMVNSAGDPTFFGGTTEYYTPSSFNGPVANFTAVNLPNGNVFAIMSNAVGVPLPVNFISFTAQPNDGNVDLNWVVGDNQEASSYEVDRSQDGVNFAKIAELPNNADQTNYSYVDANPGAGTHYYRVLETDQDGKSIYSKVVSATIGAGDFSVAVLNNPAVGKTDAQLQITAGSSGVAYIELWSLGGARISLQQEAIGTGTTTISVPMSSLAPGSYVVKVMVNNNTHVAQVVKL
jgi:hypothetical protein